MAAWLLTKPAILLALIALIALSLWGMSCECRRILNPPKPRPPIKRDYEVVRATTGASIEVEAGIRGRRTETVGLANIAAPSPGLVMAEASRQSLEKLAGKIIRVEIERTGLFRGEPSEAQASQRRLDATPETTADSVSLVESRGPIVGTVYGESGTCLNFQQVADGMAECLPTAPKEWRAAEKQARKLKLGIWGAK